MLDVFKGIEEYDTIFFVPHPDDDNQVKVEVAQYIDKGIKLDGSEIGDMFDIIIFRFNEEYDIIDLDRFEGILIEPREYVSRMLKSNWFGMVTRKTTTSKTMADNVFANWSNMCDNNE